MTAADYKAQRQLRGTQMIVAAQLGVSQATVSDRENGATSITTEAWLALLALPKSSLYQNEKFSLLGIKGCSPNIIKNFPNKSTGKQPEGGEG